jgi:hypothetical protein
MRIPGKGGEKMVGNILGIATLCSFALCLLSVACTYAVKERFPKLSNVAKYVALATLIATSLLAITCYIFVVAGKP